MDKWQQQVNNRRIHLGLICFTLCLFKRSHLSTSKRRWSTLDQLCADFCSALWCGWANRRRCSQKDSINTKEHFVGCENKTENLSCYSKSKVTAALHWVWLKLSAEVTLPISNDALCFPWTEIKLQCLLLPFHGYLRTHNLFGYLETSRSLSHSFSAPVNHWVLHIPHEWRYQLII